MKPIATFICFLICISICVKAQAQEVVVPLSGTVIEATTEEPMAFVKVELFREKESLLVQTTLTDTEGDFSFHNVSPGTYFLQITFIGFDTLLVEPFKLESSLDLGDISIQISPITLNEVEITDQKSAYTHSIDRKVYLVENDVLSQSGSATDVMQNIPSVSVDVNGQVSLRGTSNITFFINGRPSALLRVNPVAALQQMPANSIERIEVITNPSAKYKPDGTGGIINIVLKKGSRQGFHGTLTGNIGNMSQYNGNLTLNYNSGKVNIFGSYGFRRTNRPSISTDFRVDRDSLGNVISTYDNTRTKAVQPIAHIINGGIEYSINDENKIEISGNYYRGHSFQNYHYITKIHDGNEELISNFYSDRTNDEYEEEYEVSVAFEHEFEKEDHTLLLEFNYSGYDEFENNLNTDVFLHPKVADARTKNLILKGGPLAEFYLEYVYPIGEDTELEAGYVGEFFRDDIRFLGENFDGQKNLWTIDENKTNSFRFRQDIHAAYTTLGHSIENFSFLAGLRAEQVFVRSKLSNTTFVVPNDYFKLYPTLHLQYEVGEEQQFQMNYSRRVNRADSDEHNPFAEYSDPRNKEAGNPRLKPEQIHSVEFGYHLKKEDFSLIPSIYYRYTFDAFTEIDRIVDDTVVLTTYTNLSNEQAAGFEFVLSGEIKNKLDLNFSTNTYYKTIDASNLGFSEKKSIVTFQSKLAANLSVTKSTQLQLNAQYRSARLTPQGNYGPVYLLNAGARQNLLKDKASLTLTVSDVFRSLNWKSLIDTPTLYRTTSYRRNTRIVYVGFIYSFGNTLKKGEEKLRFEDAI